MSVYLHMVPETEVDYSRRGPGAYDALASGKVPSSFRGLPVFTSYPLDTDFNGARRPVPGRAARESLIGIVGTGAAGDYRAR